MTGWAKMKLRAVTSKIGSGATPLGGDEVYRASGISFIRSLNIYDDGFRLINLAKIDETQAKRLSNVVVEPGDVLLNITGASVARCCVVPDGLLPARVNQHVCIIRPQTRKLDSRFLHRLLTFRDYKDRLLRTGESGGATRQAITKAQLEEFEIEYPVSLSEQQRIAKILDAADALRARRRAALAQIDTLTQSIFLDMFGDPVVNPKGWRRRTTADVGDIITGNTPPRAVASYYGPGIEWIKSDNVNTPEYYLTQAEESLTAEGRAVARTAPPGSILITCIAGSPECIGNSAMADREVAFNQQINAFVPREGDPHFFYAQFRVGKSLVQAASTSGMKGMVSKGRFEMIELVCPPLSLQREFGRRAVGVEELRTTHRASLAELDALFASLQHRAFRGEL